MRTKLPRVENCLNCGVAILGRYCHECGQESTNRSTSLQPLFADFVTDVLSFDSKLVHTLAPLLLSPGRLTVDYNLGKRARYLSPLKIYLFMSVLFFLLLSRNVGKESSITLPQPKVSPTWKQESGVRFSNSGITFDEKSVPPSLEAYEAWQKDATNKHKDNLFEQYVTRKALKVRGNLNGFGAEFINSIARAMFLLLPLFALLLKGIYFRRRKYYVEHLVFALHVHAFAFFLLSIAQIPRIVEYTPLFLLWILGYLFFAMRRVYEQTLFKTLLKMGILCFCYLFLLVLLLLTAGLLAVVFF